MIDIEKEFDKFFEFPTDDKSQVSSTSCKLFAVHIAELERNKFGEPVAWMWDNDGVIEYSIDIYAKEYYEKHYGVVMTPLYAKKG